jgi:hypothetical protein
MTAPWDKTWQKSDPVIVYRCDKRLACAIADPNGVVLGDFVIAEDTPWERMTADEEHAERRIVCGDGGIALYIMRHASKPSACQVNFSLDDATMAVVRELDARLRGMGAVSLGVYPREIVL